LIGSLHSNILLSGIEPGAIVGLAGEKELGEKPPKILFEITFTSFLKLLALIILVVSSVVLFRLLMLLFMGLLLAGALKPVMRKLTSKGVPQLLTASLIAFLMGLLIVAFAVFVFPEVFDQVNELIKELPSIKDKVVQYLPADGPFRQMARKLMANSKYWESESMLNHSLMFANEAMRGLTEFFLVLVFCIYLLLDNGRAYRWLRDFFKSPVRQKIDQTAEETSQIVIGYVTAQIVTSALAGVYTYVAMSLLNVPLALTLAFLAAIFDVLPVLGFFLAVVPALILAITVSPLTALITIGVYLVYHAIENYLVIPLIYGNRMKMSSLVVLISLLAAGMLGGVLPMIIILPVVASYPIIEKIWMRPYLGDRVIEKHAQETESEA
jgi:predicted PurR-regulated permease PerM